jgi:hypothetical protein
MVAPPGSVDPWPSLDVAAYETKFTPSRIPLFGMQVSLGIEIKEAKHQLRHQAQPILFG